MMDIREAQRRARRNRGKLPQGGLSTREKVQAVATLLFLGAAVFFLVAVLLVD